MAGHILIVSPVASHPQDRRDRVRICALGRLLQSAGFSVHVLAAPLGGWMPGQQAMMAAAWDGLHTLPHLPNIVPPTLPYGYRLDDWWPAGMAEVARELHRRWRFRAVLCHYVWCSQALTAFGDDVVKLIDTIEVFAGRHERLRAQGYGVAGFSTSVTEEMMGLARADVVLALDEEQAALFRARGHTDVRVLGHIARGRFRVPSDEAEVCAGYFASGEWSNQATFVALRKQLARAPRQLRLFVAGAICDELITSAPFDAQGRVEQVEGFYDRIDIALNPQAAASGVSVKSVEAISQGVPLLATRAAMIGVPSYHALHRLEGVEEVAICLRETRFGVTLRRELAAASRRAASDYAASVRAAARNLVALLRERESASG